MFPIHATFVFTKPSHACFQFYLRLFRYDEHEQGVPPLAHPITALLAGYGCKTSPPPPCPEQMTGLIAQSLFELR